MNQLMRVGSGIVFALDRDIRREEVERLHEIWRDHFPDIPLIAIPNTQIVQQGEGILFQFTGEITSTVVAEFQRWWEEVNVEG